MAPLSPFGSSGCSCHSGCFASGNQILGFLMCPPCYVPPTLSPWAFCNLQTSVSLFLALPILSAAFWCPCLQPVITHFDETFGTLLPYLLTFSTWQLPPFLAGDFMHQFTGLLKISVPRPLPALYFTPVILLLHTIACDISSDCEVPLPSDNPSFLKTLFWHHHVLWASPCAVRQGGRCCLVFP